MGAAMLYKCDREGCKSQTDGIFEFWWKIEKKLGPWARTRKDYADVPDMTLSAYDGKSLDPDTDKIYCSDDCMLVAVETECSGIRGELALMKADEEDEKAEKDLEEERDPNKLGKLEGTRTEPDPESAKRLRDILEDENEENAEKDLEQGKGPKRKKT